jgi:hypothetical protein
MDLWEFLVMNRDCTTYDDIKKRLKETNQERMLIKNPMKNDRISLPFIVSRIKAFADMVFVPLAEDRKNFNILKKETINLVSSDDEDEEEEDEGEEEEEEEVEENPSQPAVRRAYATEIWFAFREWSKSAKALLESMDKANIRNIGVADEGEEEDAEDENEEPSEEKVKKPKKPKNALIDDEAEDANDDSDDDGDDSDDVGSIADWIAPDEDPNKEIVEEMYSEVDEEEEVQSNDAESPSKRPKLDEVVAVSSDEGSVNEAKSAQESEDEKDSEGFSIIKSDEESSDDDDLDSDENVEGETDSEDEMREFDEIRPT